MSRTPKIAGEILGLDIGQKRIGVARMNTVAQLAEPMDVINVDENDPFSTILELQAAHNAQALVIGLPRGLDGQETQQTANVRDFARQLLKRTDVPLYFIDEAGTTEQAKNQHKSANYDSYAACIMLDDFIRFKDKESLRITNG